MRHKKIILNQKYENYWPLTLEYSNIYGKQFNVVLKKIVELIDNLPINHGIDKDNYKSLTKSIESIFPKSDSASTRKSINQMYKLGFINNGGKSYHYLTKQFLSEYRKENKRQLFSKIVYENASFNRSYQKETNEHEINFLVKTLEKCEFLNKDQILALMYTKISDYPKGYLTKDELDAKTIEILNSNADVRKYNQQKYLFDVCSNLNGIYSNNKIIAIDKDLILSQQELDKKTRDNYLQKLFKIDLINEVIEKYKTTVGMCVLEKIKFPILIASHIKPYHACSKEEEFDKDNGLLLSKNMDSLFDQGYITFNNEGCIIPSKMLDEQLSKNLQNFKLDECIFNEKRKQYMVYHRKYVFRDSPDRIT